MEFNRDCLKIDARAECIRLEELIKKQIMGKLKRGGAVVGISGGIDSSVVAALCVRALGKDRVLGLIMPENDSSPDSQRLAEELARGLGIDYIVEDITPALDGFGCYRRRDEAIKRLVPEFGPDYKAKITIASKPLESDSINFFKLIVEAPDGSIISKRMPLNEYLQIVAASNFKQRTRMAMLYYHAERLNRAVVGTGNKDEHELGFFVKYGDGGADLKPISHLYKVQVCQLARFLKLPENITGRAPTTDTYSAEVTQTDFFFGVDFEILDLIWYGLNDSIPSDEVARALDLTAEQVDRVYKDIKQKQRTTEYLRLLPLEPEA
ncbi:MAG TPA: NAD(+) synthase [candidate division Zixibacteria bacterium]|nr:NAD(+) synthase [candidate division Zixibacteria bacterium]